MICFVSVDVWNYDKSVCEMKAGALHVGAILGEREVNYAIGHDTAPPLGFQA